MYLREGDRLDMVMRGLKAARLRQKETINYNISVSLVLTLLHIYVLFLTGRNKSKPICSQLMSKCNYSNARKKSHKKKKRRMWTEVDSVFYVWTDTGNYKYVVTKHRSFYLCPITHIHKRYFQIFV